MKLSIFYNWPIGKDSATVTLGMPNVEDLKFLFRLSVLTIKDESKNSTSSDWINYNEVSKLNISILKNSKIRLEKKSKETDLIEKLEIDCEKEWPPEAEGITSVDTGNWI